MSHILFFGLGYSAKVLARRLAEKGWSVSATSRSEKGVRSILEMGYTATVFDGSKALHDQDLDGVSHIVSSVPPDDCGDPVLRLHKVQFALRAKQIQWAAYLSTTGVYGDHSGGLVTEDTPLTPNTSRGQRRQDAEAQWVELYRQEQFPTHLFRLAGIYGPGRNQLVSLLDGTAKRIIKPGQVFSRIHVDDIATVLEASIANPCPGRAYNVCDDEAAPPQDVIAYGAGLLGLPLPPDIPYENADLSPMARSFYADSKRVSNVRIKTELGVVLRYPTYREGLNALVENFKD